MQKKKKTELETEKSGVVVHHLLLILVLLLLLKQIDRHTVNATNVGHRQLPIHGLQLLLRQTDLIQMITGEPNVGLHQPKTLDLLMLQH